MRFGRWHPFWAQASYLRVLDNCHCAQRPNRELRCHAREAFRLSQGRPLHLRPAALAQVAVGGLFGAAGRGILEEVIPSVGSFPVATFVVNVTGAFVLGLLLESLVRSGDDSGHRRSLRLVVGTGFVGAYTTYSTFAVESAVALGGKNWPMGVFYVLASLAAGLFAVTVGIVLAAGRHKALERRSPKSGAARNEAKTG